MKIFYSKHERNITIVLITFISGVILGLLTNIEKDPLELIIPALTTLVAAFLGAYFAFRFQNNREEEKKHQNNVEAANRALFNLSRIINELEVIKKQVIDPVRDRPDRYLAMQPFLIPNYDDMKFNIDSLTFLLESKSPNILGEILVEETNFHQVINSLNNRSELHRYQVQPILEAAGVRVGGQYLAADIERALGQRIFIQIQNATDNLIEHVDETLVSSQKIMDKLVSNLKRIYPKSEFLILDKQRKPNKAPQPTP
jgi:hypothetical protein